MTNFEAEIHRFIADKFLFGDDKKLADNDSLLEAGIVDSTGILVSPDWSRFAYWRITSTPSLAFRREASFLTFSGSPELDPSPTMSKTELAPPAASRRLPA